MRDVSVSSAPSSSSLSVNDLVRSPALQLRVLAGAAGLGRSVSWAHVSELEDPTPWLLGAEVIMTTGLAVPRSAARQRAYVHRLDDAGVSGLALSAQLHVPPLHRAFTAAADERGLPVLEVPLPVPFIAIAQEVAAAVQGDVRQRLGAQLQVFGALRWVASEDVDAAEVFRRLERLSGYALYLCSPQHRSLLPGVPVPEERHRGLLPTGVGEAPPTVPGGYVLPVPAPGGAAGYLLALERSGARHAGLAVVQHIATVAALQLAMRRQESETLRREGAETLAEMLAGLLDEPLARRRLARAGVPAAAEVQLAVLRGQDGPVNADAVVRALQDGGAAHLLLRQQRDLVVLAVAGAELTGALSGLAGTRAGASRPFVTGTALEVPRREALWALARATDSRRSLVVYGADSTGRWLADDAGALRALVDQAVGAAARYDAAHGSTLLHSVRTWMERDRRTDDAARALHVHPNTLTYRLRRFETLTGRTLASTSDLAEVWLALQAAGHLGDPL